MSIDFDELDQQINKDKEWAAKLISKSLRSFQTYHGYLALNNLLRSYADQYLGVRSKADLLLQLTNSRVRITPDHPIT